jgi:hypothetical protein
MTKITDLTRHIDIDVKKRAVASQSKGDLWPLLFMGLQKLRQWKISHYIPIITEDSLVICQKIFDVFQPARCVEKDWFMTKEDRHTVPKPIRKFF